MRNNFINKIIVAVFALCFSANAAYCEQLTLKTTITKFGLAMFGVLFFSILLYVGLTLYNKLFVAPYVKDVELRDYSLHSPKDKEEAIMMYISKNRLK